jgi:putative SOS response-associated peptidase YedK
MCGRYALYETDELGSRYGVNVGEEIEPNYNAAPTQIMPVVTTDGIELMRWGLIPKWARDEKIGYKLFNARSETLFEKPIWKTAVTRHRCLVPANGFYEWQKRDDGKQPYYIHPKTELTFSFAGVWETWKHDGQERQTYSILTTEPNREMSPIHNRMPVILYREDESQWLNADSREEIEVLLNPYQDNGLEMFEVSKEINLVKNNAAELILPVNSL